MKNASKVVRRAALVLLTTLLIVVAALYALMWILVNGPSPTARRLFILSVRETSAAGFLANLYLSDAEIGEILADSSFSPTGVVTASPSGEGESDLPPEIIVPGEEGTVDKNLISPHTPSASAPETQTGAEEAPDIELVDITGPSYRGKLMIIKDPSRVFIGIPPEGFGEGKSGMPVIKMTEAYDCEGGVNAGGFYDPNGKGTGGIPEGIVIYDGELLWGESWSSYSIIGFDSENILHVGVMTGKRALELDMKYAVSFGPALIINGTPANERRSLGGGINPRTAIGQRADGAVLLLVINGRQLDSLGATLDDLIEVMLTYGAVNASNLDGGSSSLMIYGGEYVTSSAYVFGERVVATSVLVRKKQ